jgi:hypothetical protein
MKIILLLHDTVMLLFFQRTNKCIFWNTVRNVRDVAGFVITQLFSVSGGWFNITLPLQ